MSEEMVTCHVCKGSKKRHYDNTIDCLCCEGKGEITKKRQSILFEIGADLAKRLREQS